MPRMVIATCIRVRVHVYQALRLRLVNTEAFRSRYTFRRIRKKKPSSMKNIRYFHLHWLNSVTYSWEVGFVPLVRLFRSHLQAWRENDLSTLSKSSNIERARRETQSMMAVIDMIVHYDRASENWWDEWVVLWSWGHVGGRGSTVAKPLHLRKCHPAVHRDRNHPRGILPWEKMFPQS